MTFARRVLLAQAVAAVFSLLALRALWPSVGEFVHAIDHGDVPFADFVFHYYPTARDSIRAGAPAGGFFYPAGFAVLLAPIGWAELPTAEAIWFVVLAGAAGWTASWVVRAATPKQPALSVLGTILMLTSVPLLHDFKWGQVSVLIVAAGASAFVLHERGAKRASAVLLGLSAAIKGYPLAFMGWFVLRRDVRFLVRAAIASAVTLLLLPALVMGPAHALFFQRVATMSVLGAADGVLWDFNSQFTTAVLARYHGGYSTASPALKHAGDAGALVALAAIAGLLLLVSSTRARRIAERRALWAFVLLASTVPFWLKTSWTHYFVHLPLAQILLASTLTERSRPRDVAVLALLVAPSVFLSNVLGLCATDGWWAYADSGAPYFANLLCLFACALVLVDAHLEGAQTRREGARPSHSARTVSE